MKQSINQLIKNLENESNDLLKDILFSAVVNNNIEIIEILIKYNININVRDDLNNTPLIKASQLNNIEVVKLLIKNSPILTIVNAANYNKSTALHYAAFFKYFDIVKVLLEAGANYTLKDSRDESPIDIARKWQDQELIDLFTVK
jgi:ankyrin repeat protein